MSDCEVTPETPALVDPRPSFSFVREVCASELLADVVAVGRDTDIFV